MDGLRAIATLFVLAYHLLPDVIASGFGGVDMFFVLSGFLITSLLLDEKASTGRINLKKFWVRRLRRLVPAVVVTCLAATAMALIVGGDALVALPRQVAGALTATYNWVEIVHGSSYFEHASPLLLTNMWSLAVEQQFYVVWPLIVWGLLAFPPRYRIVSAAVLGAGSVAIHLLTMGDDLSRAYMGTDSHLWGLMIGAGIAFYVPDAMTTKDRRDSNADRWAIAGIIGLAIDLATMVLLPEKFMYPWGMIAVSLGSGLVVRSLIPDVSVQGPARVLAKILDLKPLTWLGERSYGIYLWHWPLWVLTFYAAPMLNVWAVAALVVLASIGMAALSFRFIETPIRLQGWKEWCRHLWHHFLDLKVYGRAAVGVVTTIVLFFSGWAMAVSPPKSSAALAVEAGREKARIQAEAQAAQSAAEAAAREQAAQSAAATTTPMVAGTDVTVIGDSITVAAMAGLEEAYPGIYTDGEVSRSIEDAPTIIQSLIDSASLRPYVVVSLATNTLVTAEQIQALVDQVGPDRRLILVTGFGPARTTWIPPANDAIRNAAKTFDNVFVADWGERISQHQDLLAGDAVHPADEQGVAVYVAALTQALNVASVS